MIRPIRRGGVRAPRVPGEGLSSVIARPYDHSRRGPRPVRFSLGSGHPRPASSRVRSRESDGSVRGCFAHPPGVLLAMSEGQAMEGLARPRRPGKGPGQVREERRPPGARRHVPRERRRCLQGRRPSRPAGPCTARPTRPPCVGSHRGTGWQTWPVIAGRWLDLGSVTGCRRGACPRGVSEDRGRSQSSGRAAKACLVSRYQPIDFLGWRQRLFMASRASW